MISPGKMSVLTDWGQYSHLFVLIYITVVWMYHILRSRRHKLKNDPSEFMRIILLCLNSGILLTYVASPLPPISGVSDSIAFYTIIQWLLIVVWSILGLKIVKPVNSRDWNTLRVSATLVLFGEIAGFLLCFVVDGSKLSWRRQLSAVHALRGLLLLGFVSITGKAPSAATKQKGGNVGKDAVRSGQGQKDKDENNLNPFAEKSSWKAHGRAVAFLLPFLWPINNLGLQIRLVGAVLCMLVTRALRSLVPLQLGHVVNLLGEHELTSIPYELGILVLLRLLISGTGLNVIESYLWSPVEINATQKVSVAAYNHLMYMSKDFHDTKDSGNLWQTVKRGRGVVALMRIICFQIVPMILDVHLAIGILCRMFDIYLALIAASVVILSMWISFRSLSRKTILQREYMAATGLEHSLITETSLNWSTVAYHNRFEYEMGRYASAVRLSQSSISRFFFESMLMDGLRQVIGLLGLMAASYLVARQIQSAQKNISDFVMLTVYWPQLVGPLEDAAQLLTQVTRSSVETEKLIELLSKKPSVADSLGVIDLRLTGANVEFDHVEFSYDGKRKVLNNISFKCGQGQTIAFVGETGGGKSTIFNLMFRFYDPQKGTITIDGQDIRDVKLKSLRENIAVVPQDPSLFNTTILQNLQYAKPCASLQECQEACKAAAIHEKIMALPSGYATVVGERGVRLSGGELQRIALARAILKDSMIVCLDEATSNVDGVTEARIQASLRHWTKSRTTFIIAHRLSTVIHADCILVVKDGCIVERGLHEHLLSANGYYYRLWTKQIGSGQSERS